VAATDWRSERASTGGEINDSASIAAATSGPLSP
jgi:hypothetical protein